MQLSVKEATFNHEKDLVELVVKFREEHSRLIGGDRSVDRGEVRDEVRSALEGRKRGYLVAVDEGEVLGYRSWELRDEFYFTTELFVRPDCRNDGVAKELIRKMEDWLLDRGQEIACISCVPQNVAMIELARSEGYRILNRIELRKNLTEEPLEPDDEIETLGYRWDIF